MPGRRTETVSAPALPRKCRRLIWLFMRVPFLRRGGAAHGAHDRRVGGATALQAGERILDLGVGRLRGFLKQRNGGHDPAVHAVAALWDLLIDEGLLHLVRLAVGVEPAHGRDLALADRID